MREQIKNIFLLFVILSIALFFRTSNLNEVPVFADEAIYVRWAQVMRAEPTLRFLPLSDGKQPLFMWSVIPFFKLFADPLVAGRMVSALSGIATMLGVMIATLLLLGSYKKLTDIPKLLQQPHLITVSLISGLFYAISPFTVFFDRMALADSMLSMFGVFLFIFALVSFKTLRLDVAMFAGFTLGGAALTKSPALFMAIMLPSLWLLSDWGKNKKMHVFKLIGLTIVVWGIGLVMYNVLRLGPNFHLLSSRTSDYVYPVGHILERPLDPLMPFVDRSFEYLWALGPAFLVILSAVAVINKKHWKSVLVVFIWFSFPIFVVSEFSKTMTARYIYYSLPFFMILSSFVFINSLVKRILDEEKYKTLKTLLVFAFALFISKTIVVSNTLITSIDAANLPRSERSGYLEEWTAGGGIKEASMVIREMYYNNPDQKIVVGTEGYFGTLPDGMQMYLNDIPDITVIGVGVIIEEVPVQLIESVNAGNTTYLVINSSRLKINETDFEKNGLSVVQSWQKPDRPNTEREYAQYGPHDKLYLLEVHAVASPQNN